MASCIVPGGVRWHPQRVVGATGWVSDSQQGGLPPTAAWRDMLLAGGQSLYDRYGSKLIWRQHAVSHGPCGPRASMRGRRWSRVTGVPSSCAPHRPKPPTMLPITKPSAVQQTPPTQARSSKFCILDAWLWRKGTACVARVGTEGRRCLGLWGDCVFSLLALGACARCLLWMPARSPTPLSFSKSNGIYCLGLLCSRCRQPRAREGADVGSTCQTSPPKRLMYAIPSVP
jgi:hypothetical protein